MRTDGRKPNQLRPVEIQPNIIRHAEGSVMIKMGHTHVICTASVEPGVPKFLMGSGEGWVTAEYGMLPRSTHSRMRRDKTSSGGRSQEISRLIGRSLRSCIDLKKLGERQITVDCDVIQADGGTRTAAITGAFVALKMAIQFLMKQGEIKEDPIKCNIAAISIGLNGDTALLDLNYDEDSNIDTDMNFVINDEDEFVEIQGTAETGSFSHKSLQNMIELAQKGCRELIEMQNNTLSEVL
ncbi:MAG: ribonuclease PH [Bdellovibrionales bacterium]